MIVDINALKETEEHANYLAEHDALRGLPNRHHLHATFSERVAAIEERGFKISIDHFCPGYSNLAYLNRYPLDGLKIDRSLISAPDEARPIAELILSMSNLLDLEIVAKGIETSSQLACLRTSQCHQYQGYLFSAAVSTQDFDMLLE